MSGDLTSGDRLVETQLAQQLQVSRTPIREALRQLQQEGLVTADTNGGLRVTAISVTDAAHLYDCRMALEQVSVAGACENASELQLQTLEKFVIQAEKLTQRETSELNNFQLLDLDYKFHRLIAESSGNKWLVSLLDQVFDKMMLLRIQTMRQNPKVLEIRIEHQEIFAAIAQRNIQMATEAIQNHLMASKKRVVEEVRNLGTGD